MAPGERSIPNFLTKLWNMLEGDDYSVAIQWDPSGVGFHILDPPLFSREVLPAFFKHNNLSSFIRQLNMYGFHKVTPVERAGLNRSQSDQEFLEFHHPHLVRGRPDLLRQIKRKAVGTGASSSNGLGQPAQPSASAHGPSTAADPAHKVLAQSIKQEDEGSDAPKLSEALDKIRRLQEKQEAWDAKLEEMRRVNEEQYRDLEGMRASHFKQQQVVGKLIQVLHSVLQPSIASAVTKRLASIDGQGGTADEDGPTSSKQPRIWEPQSDPVASDAQRRTPSPGKKLEALHQELRQAAPLHRAGPLISIIPPSPASPLVSVTNAATNAATLQSTAAAAAVAAVLAASPLSCPAALASVEARSEPILGAHGKRCQTAGPSVWDRLASRASEVPGAAPTNSGGLMLPVVPYAQEFANFMTDIETNLGSIQRQLTEPKAPVSLEQLVSVPSELAALFGDLPRVNSSRDSLLAGASAASLLGSLGYGVLPPSTLASLANPASLPPTNSTGRPLFGLSLEDEPPTPQGPGEAFPRHPASWPGSVAASVAASASAASREPSGGVHEVPKTQPPSVHNSGSGDSDDLLNTPQHTPKGLGPSGDSNVSLRSSGSTGLLLAQALLNSSHHKQL